jgi:acetophenone carboxylase
MGSFGYGSKFPATLGIFGGYAVPPVFITTVRNSTIKKLLFEGISTLPTSVDQIFENENPEEGRREFHHMSMNIQPFMNGETFYVTVGGGAGYGDPLEREPQAVLKDLRDGIATHWAAKNIYRIAYDEQSLRLDEEKTVLLRKQVREERMQQAKPYALFETEWLKLKPPSSILKGYGAYPHPGSGVKTDN